jgi:serine/threonine protein kinase
LLKLKPCGLQIVPDSLNLLLSALRSVLRALEGIHKLGYAHRDVRWPNILYVTDEDWRLIDFENSSWGDSSLMNNDLRMVGELMSRCGSLVLSSGLLSLHEQLISERPPGASEALEFLITSECNSE